jgi:hypothetical protein
MNRLRLPILLVAACAISARPAAATPVTYSFTGTLTFLNVLSADPASRDIDVWLPGLTNGMSMSGSFVFDAASGQADLQVALGSYVFGGNGFTETVVNDSTFAVNDTTVPFGDAVGFWDAFPTMLTPPPSAFLPDDLVLNLWDSTGGSLSSPTVHSGDLGAFTHRLITFDGLGFSPRGSAIVDWQGTIDHFQATPEPSTLLLVCSGVIGLGGTARKWAVRRRRRNS